jgi:hypothetical protein
MPCMSTVVTTKPQRQTRSRMALSIRSFLNNVKTPAMIEWNSVTKTKTSGTPISALIEEFAGRDEELRRWRKIATMIKDKLN